MLAAATALLLGLSLQVEGAATYSWSTAWGRATFGSEDGPVTTARFRQPHGLATDAAGNLYVADSSNHTIRRIGADGTVTTIAGVPGEIGSADGRGAAARFNSPKGIALAPDGALIVADQGNHTLRRVTPDGVVTTVAGVAGEAENRDGPLATARLYYPEHITVDRTGAILVHAGVNGIRRVRDGRIETWIPASEVNRLGAQVDGPYRTGPIVAGPEDDLYFLGWDEIAGSRGAVLRRRDSAGNFSTLSLGWGSGSTPQTVPAPLHLARGPNGVYVEALMAGEQIGRYWVFRVTSLTTAEVVGRQWIGATGMAVGVGGEVFLSGFADDARVSIDAIARLETASGGQALGNFAQPWAGEVNYLEGRGGDRSQFRLGNAFALAADESGNVWVADVRGNNREGRQWYYPHLLKLAPDGSTAVVSSHVAPVRAVTEAAAVAIGSDGTAYFSSELSSGLEWRLAAISREGVERVVASRPYPEMRQVRHMAVDSAGNFVFAHFGKLRKLSASGEWSTLAGVWTTGTPEGPAEGQREIRDGLGSAARFGGIIGMSADRAGNIYVLDTLEQRAVIRRVSPAGLVTTVTGNLYVVSGFEGFPPIAGPARDAEGNFYLVYAGGSIRRVTPSGSIEVIGGGPNPLFNLRDGLGTEALFAAPEDIAVDGAGRVFVLDGLGLEVRVGTPSSAAPTSVAQPTSATSATATLGSGASSGGNPTSAGGAGGGANAPLFTLAFVALWLARRWRNVVGA